MPQQDPPEQQPPPERRSGAGYRPLAGHAPVRRAAADALRQHTSQGGATRALRRLKASRAGRLSTVGYRPLPPTGTLSAGAPAGERVARLRLGDTISLRCPAGELRAALPDGRGCCWTLADGSSTDDSCSGEFELHAACSYSKQRGFSGLVRQLLGHRSWKSAEDGHAVLAAVEALPGVDPRQVDALTRKLRDAEAERRSNALQAEVGRLEGSAVESGARVQLRHVASGRWLACRAPRDRNEMGTGRGRRRGASGLLELRTEGDEGCWWSLRSGRPDVYLREGQRLLLCADGPAGIPGSGEKHKPTLAIGPPPAQCGAARADGEREEPLLGVGAAPAPPAAQIHESDGWTVALCRSGQQPDATASASSEAAGEESPGAFPPELRVERVVEYDAARYPFGAMLRRILQTPAEDEGSSGEPEPEPAPEPEPELELGQLHRSEEARLWILRNPKHASRNLYDRRYKSMTPAHRQEFLSIFRRFLAEVIAPALGAPHHHRWESWLGFPTVSSEHLADRLGSARACVPGNADDALPSAWDGPPADPEAQRCGVLPSAE